MRVTFQTEDAAQSSKARHHWATVRAKLDAIYKMQHGSHVLYTAVPDGTSIVHAHEDLQPAEPEEQTLPSMIRRASSRKLRQEEQSPPKPFLPAACASIFLGVVSVVPYNLVMKRDPGSPLFVSFLLHLAIVAKNLPLLPKLLKRHAIPWHYHARMVLFGCLFTSFKSDAYVRLPAAVCMLLSNMRMVVGVILQFCIFGQRYGQSQLLGAAGVTAGIAWAGYAMQQATATASLASKDVAYEPSSFIVGVLEVVVSSTSLALLSITVKLALSRFGEAVEEQVFIQHLAALPLVFPSQWDKVGPRFHDWYMRGDAWLLLNLLASVVTTFAARSAAAMMAGRSPNLLTTQLVQTLECFLQLLIVAFLRVPPYPPAGFWFGTAVLMLGTFYYLRASDSPERAAGEMKR